MTFYYLDTCIWRDFYENRLGFDSNKLGEHAAKLVLRILEKKDTLLFSDLVIKELRTAFTSQDIEDMFAVVNAFNILEKVDITEDDYAAAVELAEERKIPKSDVLHAILAKKSDAILVSRDKHFIRIMDVIEAKKPEELI